MEEPTASLRSALAAFQAELPRVAKGSVNDHFRSKYADLDDVTSVVVPLLAKHGLAWTCVPTANDAGAFGLRYSLLHGASSASIEGWYPLPDPQSVGPHAVGSAITYARRYTLLAVTGVAAGDDDDGNGAQAAHQETDWQAVLAEMGSNFDVAELRQMWARYRLDKAPKEVQQAFMAHVKQAQEAETVDLSEEAAQ